MPRLDVVKQVVAVLTDQGVTTALGGSGLLAALELTDHVRDWDLTTDAEAGDVRAALARSRLTYSLAIAGEDSYATRARFRVEGDDHEVDLIVGFAVRSGSEVHLLPTRVTRYWQGLPIGDPAVWMRAYQLLGRQRQAASLRTWLAR